MAMSGYFSALPSLSSTKPAPAAPFNEEKKEKKRLAQYSLKPRFAYAFEAWHAQELRWSFEGNYTNPCILTAVSHLVKHIDSLIETENTESLPCALTLFPLSESILPSLRDLPASLDLSETTKSYLADVVFISLVDAPTTLSRIFQVDDETNTDPTRRFKADMLVLASPSTEIADHALPSLSASTSPESNIGMLTPGNVSNAANSPAMSASALEEDEDVRVLDNEKGDRLGLNVQGLRIS